MITESMKYRKTSQLHMLTSNPRKISEAGMRKLCESLRLNGFWEHRPLAIEEEGDGFVVLAGNQRLKAAKKCGIKEVPTICYHDLADDERKEIILRDNINNGEWDIEELKSAEWRGMDFEFVGLDVAEELQFSESLSNQSGDTELEDENDQELMEEEPVEEEDEAPDTSDFQSMMFKDVLYESNNDFDIPNLLLEGQAGKLELPFTPWGANSRLKKDVATYHFYVDDYRFEQLWKDPIKLVLSGVKAIVEPNCSLHDQTPIAFGLERIYKKRWLARYLQELGIKVYVDLNVSHKFSEYNKMGIPKGYNAFMTRGTDGWIKSLEIDLKTAQEISGLERPNLMVYGGGKSCHEFCKEHGLLWITDYINAKEIGK